MPQSASPSPLFTKAYAAVRWILDRVTGLPKLYRFTLGERLSLNALEFLEEITEAQYRSSKLALLKQADHRLTRLRVLLRLARDSVCLSPRQHEFIAVELDEIGRMLGGWIQQQQTRSQPKP